MEKKETSFKKLSQRAALIVAVIVSAPLAACAQGYQGTRDPQQFFERADLNNDNVITRDEMKQSRIDMAQKLDRNGDGVIDNKDAPKMRRFKQKFEERKGDLARNFDLNQDGVLTVDEFVNGPTAFFDRVDANGDDRLTEDEINAAQVAFESARSGK
ncbi:MAG: signal transduction protein [Oricola sp.]|jgi:Ca2+-binding EF-hand superfamily protein|nr:signal transduction protein [Oricola sp.]